MYMRTICMEDDYDYNWIKNAKRKLYYKEATPRNIKVLYSAIILSNNTYCFKITFLKIFFLHNLQLK